MTAAGQVVDFGAADVSGESVSRCLLFGERLRQQHGRGWTVGDSLDLQHGGRMIPVPRPSGEVRRRRARHAIPGTKDDQVPLPLPDTCPVTLDEN
jgi:hypothetical protein